VELPILNFLRRNIESFVFAILYIVAIVLRSKNKFDDTIFIGLIASLSTIYFGLLKLKIEYDRLFLDLFEKFNNRYDYKINDLINETRLNESKILNNNEKKLLFDYFNLCSEEYLWYKKKRIPADVWVAWKSGIKVNLEIPQIRELYIEETSTDRKKLSFYGLVEELEKVIK
jgi:hypothetical protein